VVYYDSVFVGVVYYDSVFVGVVYYDSVFVGVVYYDSVFVGVVYYDSVFFMTDVVPRMNYSLPERQELVLIRTAYSTTNFRCLLQMT
jgi:hypothetical protein